jgi:hypothetical protein
LQFDLLGWQLHLQLGLHHCNLPTAFPSGTCWDDVNVTVNDFQCLKFFCIAESEWMLDSWSRRVSNDGCHLLLLQHPQLTQGHKQARFIVLDMIEVFRELQYTFAR